MLIRYLRILSLPDDKLDGAIFHYAERPDIFSDGQRIPVDEPKGLIDWIYQSVSSIERPAEKYPMCVERLINLWFRHFENHMPIVGYPPKPGQFVRLPGVCCLIENMVLSSLRPVSNQCTSQRTTWYWTACVISPACWAE